jgi:hypothetical protein
VLAAALRAQDHAQLVAVCLQFVFFDLLVPCLDISRLENGTKPIDECRITKQVSDGLGKVQDFLRIHFGCGRARAEFPAHSSAALPAEETTHQAALVLNPDKAQRCAKLGCVAGNKSLICLSKSLWVACEFFDGLSRLLYLVVV